MRIRIVAIFSLVVLLVAPQVAHSAQSLNVNFADHYGGGTSISRITTSPRAVMTMGAPYVLCSSFNDPKCASSASATAILPICKSISQADCVEALAVSTPQVESGSATLLKTIGTTIFPADAALGTPEGSDWSLFEVSQLKSAGEQHLYAVKVMVTLEKFPGVGVKSTDFSASVIPYTLGTTNTPPMRSEEFIDPTGKTTVSTTGADPNCIWKEMTQCGVEGKFPKDARVKLTVHIGNYLSTWLHGRLTDPSVTITAIDTKQNRLTVEAQPVDVPASKTSQSVDASNSALVDSFRDLAGNLPPGDIGMMVEASDSDAMRTFARFEKFFGDKASRLDSVWSFRALGASAAQSGFATMPTTPAEIMAAMATMGAPSAAGVSTAANALGMGAAAAKCSSQVSAITGAVLGTSSTTALVGLVTTNAMTYEASPPQFVDGSLNYKVAGLHFNPDGTVFSGRYDLVMDAKVARCLYGYSDSNAPLQASVEVVDSNGSSRVTTATLREVNGWLKLGVYGFSFSSPTLKVKLTQATPVVKTEPAAPATAPAPVTTPATAPATAPAPVTAAVITKVATKAKTISCVKGKTIKKVTGATPKCPAGFKLKA